MNCLQAKTFSHWVKIYRLYLKAFPRSERKPFFIIRSMQKAGRSDVWYFEHNREFAGFATTINDDDLILLDYLAVDTRRRGLGMGSKILASLRERYAGKGLFVEIERVDGASPGQEDRWRRKQFYIANGMEELNVTARVFGVEMELLGWNCRLDFAGYRSFYRKNYSEFAARNIKETC